MSRYLLTIVRFAGGIALLVMSLSLLMFFVIEYSGPGRHLLYISEEQRTDETFSSIHVHDLKSGQSYPLIENLRGDSVDAVWSPDGTRIAFSALDDSLDDMEDAGIDIERYSPGELSIYFHQDIYVFDLRTGETENVTYGSLSEHRSPTWSPDGTKLAYLSAGRGDRSGQIYIYDLETGEREAIGDGRQYHGVALAWSPDGHHLIYVRPISTRHSGDLMLLDLRTFETTQLAPNMHYRKRHPAWSPTGDQYAFSSQFDHEAPYNIHTATLDTYSSERITSSRVFGEDHVNVAWSSDGEALAFDNQIGTIFVVSADGGDPIAITPPGGTYSQPHWRP